MRIVMRRALIGTVILLVVVATALGYQNHSKRRYVRQEAVRLTGGNPERGHQLVGYYGCNACHTITDVAGPRGKVAPPLDGIAERGFLAGELPNTSQNMQRWIREPHSVEPKTAMPDMGVTEQDAKDITAFLYTLR
jgi:cytochrome c